MMGTLPSAVVILREQTEEHPLHQVWSNISEHSSKLIIELKEESAQWCKLRLNNTTSAQTIRP